MADSMTLLDIAGELDQLREEVLEGLAGTPKSLPCKLFYDQKGSRLFDIICELPEYYLTRTEIGIMSRRAREMADSIGPNACIVEPGAGSSIKIRYLLDALTTPACYVPIEISAAHLRHAVSAIHADYPDLAVYPVEADFTQRMDLPEMLPDADRVVAFFPGSTIGNFPPRKAIEFLADIASLVGRGGGLLIGVDLFKDASIIEPAYNDVRGVTAAFNRNILNVINNAFGANFDLDAFQHHAVFNSRESRIEMRLVSRKDQTVTLEDDRIHFDSGEPIITEYSHKHRLEDFRALARQAGLETVHVWTDPHGWFSVQYLTVP